jgi:hypothetical protein
MTAHGNIFVYTQASLRLSQPYVPPRINGLVLSSDALAAAAFGHHSHTPSESLSADQGLCGTIWETDKRRKVRGLAALP